MTLWMEPPFWAAESPARPVVPRIGRTIVTPATQQVLTLAAAKAWLRIDQTDSDGLIVDLLRVATRRVEIDTGLTLLTQTEDITCDVIPWVAPLTVPVAPVQSVTSVTYVDLGGSTHTVDPSTYLVDVSSRPARIGLTTGTWWPTDARTFQPLTVRVVAGWTSPDQVPSEVVHAVRTVLRWEERMEPPTVDDRWWYEQTIANARTVLVG